MYAHTCMCIHMGVRTYVRAYLYGVKRESAHPVAQTRTRTSEESLRQSQVVNGLLTQCSYVTLDEFVNCKDVKCRDVNRKYYDNMCKEQ